MTDHYVWIALLSSEEPDYIIVPTGYYIYLK